MTTTTVPNLYTTPCLYADQPPATCPAAGQRLTKPPVTDCTYASTSCGPTVTTPKTTTTTVNVVGTPIQAGRALPFTGGDVIGTTILGVGALIVGLLLWWREARRVARAQLDEQRDRRPRFVDMSDPRMGEH